MNCVCSQISGTEMALWQIGNLTLLIVVGGMIKRGTCSCGAARPGVE